MNMQSNTGQGREATPEMTRLLDLQAQLRNATGKMAELDAHIEQAQALIAALQAGSPDLDAMQASRRRTASLVATGEASEGQLLQQEQDIATAEFQASGIAQQIGEQRDLVAGFRARRDEQVRRRDQVAGECRKALLALLMAQANEVGAAYVSAAQQLDALYGQLMELSAMVNDMTGHCAFRCLGPMQVPAFSLPVIEKAKTAWPPYQLIDYSKLNGNKALQRQDKLVDALRAAGVEID